MNTQQLERWQELHEVVKTSNSMSQIYSACKEMVALQDGYTVNIIPLKPEDHVTTVSLYEGKKLGKRKETLETIRENISQL